MAEQPSGKLRNRVWLILLFALFFAPALLAWLLVLSDWRPGTTTQHGELIRPPAPVAELPLSSRSGAAVAPNQFAGMWSLLLIAPGDCIEACEQALDWLLRVQISLNKDADRVQLLLALPPGAAAPATLPPGLEVLQLPQVLAAELTGSGTADAAMPLAVHMIDPFEFRMMKYAAPLDAQGLLKDLRRLLRLSNEEIERLRRSGARHD